MLATLSDYGLLKISGGDRQKLLQGQLTCNIDSINTQQQCHLAAHCNPQGRIISLSHLFEYQDSYYMLMQRDMVPIAHDALKKYALFYKVSMFDASNEWLCVGSDNANERSSLAITYYNARFIKLLPQNTSLTSALNWRKSNWQALNIKDGLPTIYPQTSGKFLPHEINLHKLGAISFEKGCYTGQEIIARMHYRGKLKKHMYKARITTKINPAPGDVIYATGQSTVAECGMIVDVCADTNTKDCYHTLIMIDVANALNDHLFLKSNNRVYFELEMNE